MARLTALAERLLTPHGLDRYLELIDPMLVRREIRGEVTDVRRQTAGTATLTLRPSRAWPGFRAGQHVRVTVDIDGVRRTRCYSPACSQYGGLLELTVKAEPHGLVSRHLRDAAVPGMVVGLSEPDGDFVLPARRPSRVLLISGGSGITPVLSMLRTLADENHDGEVVFLHYARQAKDVPYRAELAALAERPNITVALACTRSDDGDLRGRFSAEQLGAVAPWYRHAPAYACGPAPLLEAVGAHYAAEGLSEQLHTEAFTAALTVPDPAAAGGRVRFTRSGAETENSGRPLLEQAEEAGLRPEHGCRMGICLSCTQLKASGTVRDIKTGAVSGEEDEQIQLCVSVPVGDVDIHC
ncbi:ferredoxin reductase [Prauserella muralis]|uniref:Ferredoxin reductase n=1 Tax=Prauserella muralis TaxID=588067 RepID=A0A2V4ASM7_9PSEU|nr:ferredoxin reductase [Prauserella muralis]PXY22551.1 ferredoxin reductase [Prauserella muralis]TWE28240.1 ferredoxin-NADP reductase [Prauserella muralis]